ncbi:MAG: sugar O-acetyltransferase [Blautia sp.]
MTLEEQRARILSGEMYNDLTEELIKARKRAVFLTEEYNRSYGQPPECREEILSRILGSAGEDVFFEPNFHCEFGFHIKIGNHFYANFDCVMLDGGGIEIGDNVLFGPRVGIYTSRHAFDPAERARGACFARPVKIGNNVWIGGGVHIDCGVTIGDNTVIGAGSVITRDIPSNVVAAGVPCRVIREIQKEEKSDYFKILEEKYGDNNQKIDIYRIFV